MKRFQDFLVESKVEYKHIGKRIFQCANGVWYEQVPADEHGEIPPGRVRLSDEEVIDLGL